MFRKIRQFLQDVQNEFRKVNWPTREATIKSTSVVIAVTTVVAVFLGVIDLGLTQVMQLLITI